MVCPARPRVVSSRATGHRRPVAFLLIVLGVLLMQGSTLLHLLIVPHVACEHGELVEVHSTPSRPVAVPRDAHDVRLDPADASGFDHHHCDVLAVRCGPVAAPPFIAPPCLLFIEIAASLSERAEARPVPLLALAPKVSPPAV